MLTIAIVDDGGEENWDKKIRNQTALFLFFRDEMNRLGTRLRNSKLNDR